MATPNLTAINLSDKQGGEKFQMTPDEMKAIQKKMDDPEFMRLWAEYAQSLSDPKVREEEEAYLRQVEEEARSQGDYTMEFIFPRPVYAVELTNAPDAKRNHRVAINICESDKVERFREETTGNRRAANWFVPITVGAMRVETDPADSYKGQWEVYDAVFNPLTVSLANRDAKFMCFLTEIAVENINDGYKRRLGFEFQRLSSDVPSLGVPKNQTVRKAVPGSETAKRQAAAPVEVSLGPIKATLDSAARPAATPPPAKPAAANSAAPKPAPPAAGPQNKGVTFNVAHRGEIDLTDAWNWGKSDKRIGVPKELVVRATVPTVARAAELDVEVDGTAVDVQTEDGSVKGTAVLPFAVLPDPVSAKFDKSRRELTLVLAVVPPAAPADSAMSPSVDRRGDASSAASPEPKVPAGEEAREAAVAAEAARAAKVAQEAASAAEEAHRRERLAAAVRAQEDQKRKATAAAAAPTATAAPVAAPTTAHELEQVRAKQDAWLKGLAAATAPVTAADPKPAAGSTPAAKHADPTPSASKSATNPPEAATLGAAPAPVSNTALPTTPAAPAAASSNLLLFDDDDEEDAAWLREADREAAGEREARKKRTAEQQAQEAEEQLRRVTRVLPLTSAHLFSID